MYFSGGCVDEFKTIYGKDLQSKEKAQDDFKQLYANVSLGVCKHVCISFPELNCNSVLYSRKTQECYISQLNKDSHGMALVPNPKYDYLHRVRCNGKYYLFVLMTAKV